MPVLPESDAQDELERAAVPSGAARGGHLTQALDASRDAGPARLSDAVFERVRDAILDGTLAPGTMIRDGELAKRLEVSRMPVREALQRLARIGVIEVSASRYTRVSRVTPRLARETLEFAGGLATSIVALAVPLLTPGDRRELTRMITDAMAAIAAGGPAIVATRPLYREFARLTRNGFMIAMLADIEIAIQRNLAHLAEDDEHRRDVRETLDELRDALERGDAASAVAAVARQHRLHDRLIV
ncbi:GntR family transcriptional regulator [Microbacterium paludicola]|uniref:GntR family transcriptional regulator n=1 Tax=Microbacterium paludicola TaxID=300019 RepID=UPI003879AEC2